MSNYLSESGEDKLTEELLSEVRHEPFLVDVGAWDGAIWSNSLYFIRSGWRALLFEPSPGPFKKLAHLHKDRAGVTCLPIACADMTGTAKLFFGSDGAETSGMSTLCQDQNEWFSQARSSESVLVEVDTLTNVLCANDAPRSFGILSIDTEGMDYEVLLGLDFDAYRPTVIITEEYTFDREKYALKYSMLIKENYNLAHKVGSNTIWVDSTVNR